MLVRGAGAALNWAGFQVVKLSNWWAISGAPALARLFGQKVIKEGIYEFQGQTGKIYVGQSANLSNRISQHLKSGKLPLGNSVKTTEVLGGKTAREVAEQLRIDQLGGIQNLENIRNPIGAARQWLLDFFK